MLTEQARNQIRRTVTAELSGDVIHWLPNRFEFRDVSQVVIERETDTMWLIHIDGAVIRLAQTMSVGKIDAALTQLPCVRSEPTLPAEQEVKPNG